MFVPFPGDRITTGNGLSAFSGLASSELSERTKRRPNTFHHPTSPLSISASDTEERYGKYSAFTPVPAWAGYQTIATTSRTSFGSSVRTSGREGSTHLKIVRPTAEMPPG